MNTRDDSAAHASWEEDPMTLRTRLQRRGRQVLARLWGPAGSILFHVILLTALVVFAFAPLREAPTEPIPPTIEIAPGPIPPSPLDPLQPPQPIPTTSVTPATLSPQAPVFPTPGMPGSPDTPLPPGDLTGPTEPPPKLLPPIDPNPSPRSIPWASLPIGSGARTPFGITNSIAKWNPDKISPINNAVLLALRWLKKYQQPDGSWTGTAPPAMTALALLAFLGHAEKPDSAEFGPTVKRAILWLLANQEETGRFKGRDGNDYTQPIAAYALCEAAFMTGHPDVRAAAEQAVAVIVRGQHDNGGFNYNLNQENRNDTSYMAWCAQAMKAAEVAKLDVADLGPAAKRAIGGFRGNADPRGGFGYTGPERTGLSGAGALCMQLLGAGDAREVRDTIAFLAPATFNFEKWDKQPYSGASPLYYWYYITQAKYQHSKETFAGWNNLFVPELIRRQILEKQAIEGPDGKPADIGHWESPSKSEHTGGVVQDTCLCTLMLEVFYRYLPSYQQVASRGE